MTVQLKQARTDQLNCQILEKRALLRQAEADMSISSATAVTTAKEVLSTLKAARIQNLGALVDYAALVSRDDGTYTDVEGAITAIDELETRLLVEGKAELAKEVQKVSMKGRASQKEQANTEKHQANMSVHQGVQAAADTGSTRTPH